MDNININQPSIGMNLSKPIWQLSESEYSLLVNGNIQSFDGKSFSITNEQSNVLCNLFGDYKVIGVLPINVQLRTIFFLVNSKGESEIGYINYQNYDNILDKELHCDDCNNPTIEQTPLENITQKPLCTYHIIVNDECLGFDINSPIDATYSIDSNPDEQKSGCKTVIYFAQKDKPRRYLVLEDIPKIPIYKSDGCDPSIYSDRLDCSKIKVQKSFKNPCLSVDDIVTGGSLKAGSYQFAIAYTNQLGDEYTDYTTPTNPASIYSREITLDTGYTTPYALKIAINNLDNSFNYFKLVVLQTVNNTTTIYQAGIFPVNGTSFTYTYTGNNQANEDTLTFEELLLKRPIYNSAEIVSKVNNTLVWANLKEQREINLQPVVNKLRVKWQTVEANEGFYKNGVNVSNYTGYERDEKYAFSIQFELNNGFKTANFLLINNDKEYYQSAYGLNVDEIVNTNNALPYSKCNNEIRDRYWQVYNTAQVIGYSTCSNPSGICDASPYEYGDFGYWESTEKYPNNPEVWGDLCGEPIRHFLFPDCCVSHIHNNAENPSGNPSGFTSVASKNKIYPIGLKIDIQDIKDILNDAVTKGLLTEEEKLSVKSYTIKRGNRRNSRSVIGKGYLFDVWKTAALNGNGGTISPLQNIYYSNYPYNDFNPDPFITDGGTGMPVKHPYYYAGYVNSRYTFHGANFSFAQPFIGNELKLETVEYGQSVGQFNYVDKHSEYILLSSGAYILANSLGLAEILADIIISVGGGQVAGTTDSTGLTGFASASALTALTVSTFQNYFTYVNQWLDIIKNLGNYGQNAIYYNSVGKYTNYCCVPNNNNIRKRALLSNSRYLNTGNFQFEENGEVIRFNNFKRESSVYLSLDANEESFVFGIKKFFEPPFTFCGNDNSRFLNSDSYDGNNCQLNTERYREVSSYYASIKNDIPDQYGTIDQIEWIDTGYCGTIDWEDGEQINNCDTVFGGDTFIGRWGIKRKIPFFIQDRVNAGRGADVQYSKLSNVGKTTYSFDSLQDFTGDFSSISTLFNPPYSNFDDDTCPMSTSLYQHGWIYLYSYGIPYFITESDYNVDLRYGENEWDKNFYPNVGDISSWTQEINVPINTDNYYFYNTDYSKQNRESISSILPFDFKNSEIICRANHPNRAIWSQEYSQNWLNYLPIDYYDFPLSDGKLIGIKEIEQQTVLARQENTSRLYNAFITMDSSLSQVALGTGQMFRTRPKEFSKTDLGYGGSTQKTIQSTPFGHFYIDAQNPSVMQITGDSLKDITRDEETGLKIQWFVQNIPFNIIKDFPDIDTDNSYKYFGYTSCWDNKYDRLLITKRDYRLHTEYRGKTTFDGENFWYNGQIIFPTNPKYFCNKSWTIGYNPLEKKWLSYYTFLPNYYISTENYFQTGYNFGDEGLWTHNVINNSFQVFNGKLHPFILEYSKKSNTGNYTLQNIEYQADFLRYSYPLNGFLKENKTYDSAVIFNQYQSTGLLNLVVKEKNNFFQKTQYPKVVGNSTYILVENILNNFKFNDLRDISLQNGQPLFTYECDIPYTVINEKSISYAPQFIYPRFKSDWFGIRLINNKSNYKIENKFSFTEITKTVEK